MTVTEGRRLGPYEIVSSIGAGGMGEVWRARDIRLNRDVAIKVLPAAFAQDKERVARFRREAQVVASLSHAHIAAIHGLEENDGTLALVLEFVDGEDLAQHLTRGPLPVDEAIAVASQIAEGLEAAHEKGVVHRDLKPANIKITRDGVVKILDFGLAKAVEDDSGTTDTGLANSPTMARPMTSAGMILGTAAYMSPEQARGKAVDKRSDIWSFGVVLYEMLTGHRLFGGETVSDTLAAVLRQDVDLDRLPEATPPAVRRLLSRCLERNPTNRLHDIADARLELTSPIDPVAASSISVNSATFPSLRARRDGAFWLGWGLAAGSLLLATLLAVAGRTRLREAAQGEQRLRLHFMPPTGERLAVSDIGNLRAFAVSPDGSQLVYVVEKGATSELRRRPLNAAESTAIPATEGATCPFFSPDGKWIAFTAGAKLKKVALAGGTPVTLTDTPGFRGAVWSDDGSIYFVPDLYVPISRIPETGGVPQAVTKIRAAEGELQHRWPDVLPGGKVLLYTVGRGADWDEATIVAERLDTGERKVLVKGGSSPRYLSSGDLVYARGGSIYAISFDPKTLETRGHEVEVARNVFLDPRGLAHMDVSRTGLLVTSPADSIGGSSILSWIDREGRSERLPLPPLSYGFVSLSPRGDRVALSIGNGVSILDLARLSLNRLTLPRRAENPIWSRDGRRIYLGYEQGKSYQIFSKAADDSGMPQLVVPSDLQEDPFAFSADGTKLLSIRFTSNGQRELVIHEPGATKASSRSLFTSPNLDSVNAAFSPDARWVVYQSGDSGRPEIYVRPASGEDRKWQISVAGGTFPVWSPAGDEIFFLCGPQVLSAPVSEKDGELVAGQPRLLFDNHRVFAFDVARDGKRFLVAEDPNPGAQTRLDVVVQWAAEVRRKLEEAGTP